MVDAGQRVISDDTIADVLLQEHSQIRDVLNARHEVVPHKPRIHT